MLSYLHVATNHGLVVTDYRDDAVGVMEQTSDGGGHFISATLRPVVTIAGGDEALAHSLHAEASRKCFIAASVNFPVRHEPTTLVVAPGEPTASTTSAASAPAAPTAPLPAYAGKTGI